MAPKVRLFDRHFHLPKSRPIRIGLGILLIAAGAHQPKRRKAQARRGKRKRRPMRKAQPSKGNVVPLRKRA